MGEFVFFETPNPHVFGFQQVVGGATKGQENDPVGIMERLDWTNPGLYGTFGEHKACV
jgi:hypothetical protein